MKYLIGNWKANKTTSEVESWIDKVKASLIKPNHNLKVILCPSYLHIQLIHKEMPNLILGSQDISPYADGAYTGAVTARMLKDLVKYSIVGHSERHAYFHETESDVGLKIARALEYDITPILAVHDQNWEKQLRFVDDMQMGNVIVMYEPPEAISKQEGPIGVGEPAPIEKVKQMIALIKETAKPKAVIYGGSVKAININVFLKESEIDGVLPGSASLNAEEWMSMIANANEVTKNG